MDRVIFYQCVTCYFPQCGHFLAIQNECIFLDSPQWIHRTFFFTIDWYAVSISKKTPDTPTVAPRSHSTAGGTLSIPPRLWITAPIATMLVEIAEYTNIRPFFHGECPLITFTWNSSNFRMWQMPPPADPNCKAQVFLCARDSLPRTNRELGGKSGQTG